MAYEYTKQARLPEESANGRFSIWRWFWADPIKAFLILGLSFLSWLATYTGMLELIQANAMNGVVGFSVQIAIAFAVAMLMMMILYLLDALFSADTPKWLKPVFIVGYAFLTLISVGFGFGFYWKYLEARGEATRSASSAISQVQTALTTGQTRLGNLNNTFAKLTEFSAEKAKIEREKGGTCGRSAPGDGPRRRLRDSDAQQFDFASNFIEGRVGEVNKDIQSLNKDIQKVLSGDKSTVDPKTGTRNRFLGDLSRRLGLTIARFNSLRSDPQLQQIKDQFDNRSRQTRFDAGNGRKFNCPDGQLQIALRGAVKAIEQLPLIEKVEISAVEGSEAIVEAFRRLAVTIMAIPTFKMPPGPDEIRKMRRQAVNTATSKRTKYKDSDAGLGQRDYIPLFVALFVDLCILLISLNRRVNRLHVIKSQIKDAEEGHFSQVLDKLEELSKADQRDSGSGDAEKVLAHSGLDLMNKYIYRRHGDYYVGVPLNNDSKSRNLANLFLSLEAMGIVSPVDKFYNPFSKIAAHSDQWIKNLLMSQGNSDVEFVGKFRPYKFKKGVLANVMLDALIGTAEKVGIHEMHWAREKRDVNRIRRDRLEVLKIRLAEQERSYRGDWDNFRRNRSDQNRRRMAIESAQQGQPQREFPQGQGQGHPTNPQQPKMPTLPARRMSVSVDGSGRPIAPVNTMNPRNVAPSNVVPNPTTQAPTFRPVPTPQEGGAQPHSPVSTPAVTVPQNENVAQLDPANRNPAVMPSREQQTREQHLQKTVATSPSLQDRVAKLDQVNKVLQEKERALGLGTHISGTPAAQPSVSARNNVSELTNIVHEGPIGARQIDNPEKGFNPPTLDKTSVSQNSTVANLRADTGLRASRDDNAPQEFDSNQKAFEDAHAPLEHEDQLPEFLGKPKKS